MTVRTARMNGHWNRTIHEMFCWKGSSSIRVDAEISRVIEKDYKQHADGP